MCTTGDNGEIIILSDDDEEPDRSCSDASVLIVEVEDIKKNDVVLSQSALDEDLVITFSRRAEVLPHARYDCPIHPFTATDCEVASPVASNQLLCDQCFCYICDKLASVCVMWCQSGVCHCNSHKRSDFWNNQRSSSLLGGLKPFNLTLSEIDAPLRHAETMLQNFRQELYAQFAIFLKGKMFQGCGLNLPNQLGVIFDYTQVYEFVSSFLNQADKQNGRAAAIMRLGAAEQFLTHFQPSGGYVLHPFMAVNQAKVVLLQRVVASVQRQIVMEDFTSDFIHKLQMFYTYRVLPAELKSMKNSLCIRPWDDILLVTVLKGQNVSGVRKDKGKKDVLLEQIPIVQLRTELLQRQHRYRELFRYLRVVQTDDVKLFQPLQDLIPYFMCVEGEFMLACGALVPLLNAPASRLTPLLFLFFFRIFATAMAPKLVVSQMTELCRSDATWEPIRDAVPMKRAELVKFALRVQSCCSAVYADSECWTRLLTLVNLPSCVSVTALPAPNPQFLQEAKDVVNSILFKSQGSNIQIPRFFQEVYPDQALLLLVTGALGVRILSAALTPALPVLNAFKETNGITGSITYCTVLLEIITSSAEENVWALWWLWDTLSSNVERLNSFLQEITQEVENTTDGDSSLPFLRSIVPTLSSSAENWDHTYCSPAVDNLFSSQVKAQSQC